MPADQTLLSVRDLKTWFHLDEGTARSVDGVSFDIHAGKTLGLVGESGCGKSVTSMSILRLIPEPPGRIEGGEIFFQGRNLLRLREREMREVRGKDIAMIFQEPMTSLNPVLTAGQQVAETLIEHEKLSRRDAKAKTIGLFAKAGIPSPEIRVDQYPHEMSGGMKQRVMIAMALACSPKLLIADEPTTALDVTIQAQILDLLRKLQKEEGMSILLITHDLGVVADIAHEVAVMYAGKIVEYAPVELLFRAPKHPYTRGLFQSLPKPGLGKKAALYSIPGAVPNPLDFPTGCRFRNRCPYADGVCAQEPPLTSVNGQAVACWKSAELPDFRSLP